MRPPRYGRPDLYLDPPNLERVPHLGRYEGSPAALRRHRETWLANDYLLDLREGFARHVGSAKGSVLEVGCGMGHLHQHLGIDPSRYTGVDVNAQFLAAGRAAYPRATFAQADAAAIPFADASFDLVLCSDVLIHVEDMQAALREVVRVSRGRVVLRLRSGNGGVQGRKVVYDPERGRLLTKIAIDGAVAFFYYNVLTPAELEALLAEVGVRDYAVEDLLPASDSRMGLTKVYFDVRSA